MSAPNIKKEPSTPLSSPHTQFHKYGTPHSRQSIAHTNHTPHAHPTHSSTSQPIQIPQLHATSGKNATQTRAPTIIPSTHKRRHTTRTRTFPAATMTTPALSPDTATGASRCSVVVSPICAHHKASQPHHKPVHPTSLPPPLHPSTKRPCTCPYSLYPQHHKPPDDPTIAHVWACKLSCQLQTFKHHQEATHITPHPIPQPLHTTLTPQHRSNPSHTTRTPGALLNIKTHPTTATARNI